MNGRLNTVVVDTLGYETVEVHRFHQNTSENELDYIVQEYPVALIYNGISHAVMMATPADLEVFAKGFSLSEGIINSLNELYAIEMNQNELGIQIEMTISSRAFIALKQHRRMMVGRTGCGLCGIESLKQLYLDLPSISTRLKPSWLNQIPSAMAQLKVRQTISELTGGAHAAAWVVNGQIVALFEDVGRHNALDKLIGYLAQQKLDVGDGFVVMTSRASYELIRKCAQYNIALLATISAPTSMAIEMAKKLNLTLASFCRGDKFVLYSQ
ncbi:MAG: formate dehydrogenase accessory sulfurtransferase FdhD [Acinetobacter junii]